MAHPDIRTLGQLKASGYAPRSVKDELRAGLIRKLKAGEEVFPGILGFEETVIPQIQHAILARRLCRMCAAITPPRTENRR